MSGHSKWSKVKHQKAVTDVIKSKFFTKASRAILVAIKESGNITDPEKNFRLRLAIDFARSVNMPRENIIRVIEKGGGGDALDLITIRYEAYGPGGVALIIHCTTNNRNRSVADVKFILEKYGGHLAQLGSVSYQFTPTGVLYIHNSDILYDLLFEIVSAYEVVDIRDEGESYIVVTKPDKLHHVKTLLEERNIPVYKSNLLLEPSQYVEVSDETKQLCHVLFEKLEELDDVQNIYSNIKE